MARPSRMEAYLNRDRYDNYVLTRGKMRCYPGGKPPPKPFCLNEPRADKNTAMAKALKKAMGEI